MAEVFKFEFEADVLKALKSIQDFSKKSSEAAESIQSSFSGLEKIGAGVVAIFAGGKIVSGIEAVIHAASQEEQAIQELNVALNNNGRLTDEASKSLIEFADSLEETSKFSNEAILSTATLIENLTGLSEQGLKQATKAAVDLSAAIGIDLNSAANLVAKAANGNVETFKRYGIVIAKGKDETQTFANTLQALAKFQGTAEAQTKTFSGALIQAGNAYEQVLKAAGGFIIHNETIIGLINSVTHGMIGLANAIKNLPKLYEENSARIAELGRHVLAFISAVSAVAVVKNFGVVVSTLKGIYGGVASAILSTIQAIYAYATSAATASTASKALSASFTALKGIATLGITIALELAIAKLIEMKQEFGTLTNVFKAIGINLEIAFTKAFAAIGPTLSSFIEKLSDIPLIGKSINFSGISKGLSDAAGTASSKIAELEKNLSALRAPEELGNSLNRATASTKAGVDEANRLKRELLDAAKASEKIAPEIQKLQSDLKNAGKTQLQIIVEERKARLDLINESKRLGVINGEETAKLIAQVQIDYADKANKEIAKMNEGLLKEKLEQEKKLQEEIAKNNEELLRQKLEQEKKNQEQIQAITQGAGFAISTISGAAEKPSAPKVDVEPAIEAERKLRDQRIKLIEESFNAGTITDAQRKAAIDQITFETEEKEKAIKAEADERNKLLEKQLKQQEAATQLLAKGVGAAGAALFGPFGALAGDLVGLLAQGGDALKQVVAGIAAALPQIITTMAQAIGPLITTLIQSVPTILTGLLTGINQLIIGLVDSVPLIIQSFVDNIGPFIDSLIQGALQLIATLVEKAPDIMIALANASPKFTAALQAQAPQIIATMVKEAPKFAVAAARSFVQQIPKMAIEMARGIVDAIKSIIGSVTGVAGDVVGGIGGAISSVGDFLGFAQGGQVPAGFPNDTFPARLTSGEFVIDRTDNERLSRFLDQQEKSGSASSAQVATILNALNSKSESSQKLTINLTIGERQLADVLVDLNKRGFRTA